MSSSPGGSPSVTGGKADPNAFANKVGGVLFAALFGTPFGAWIAKYLVIPESGRFEAAASMILSLVTGWALAFMLWHLRDKVKSAIFRALYAVMRVVWHVGLPVLFGVAMMFLIYRYFPSTRDNFSPFVRSFFASPSPASTTADYAVIAAAKQLTCSFPITTANDWTNDEPVPDVERQDFAFTITAINLETNTARMVGNIGESTLSMGSGGGALHFAEFTDSGNWNTTTVWPHRVTGGGFKAVHSRHIDSVGGPLPSQAYGSCIVE